MDTSGLAVESGSPGGPARDLITQIAAEQVRAALFGTSRPPQVRRYHSLRAIGRGGQGVVFAATDPVLGREVALKLVEASSTSERQRVIREAQLLARLSHPNIATIYDVGTVDGSVFLAIELITGPRLNAWLASAPRSLAEIVEVMDQIAQALAFAHAARVLHCDVKPQNVLIADDGRVRVVDFGLARLHGTETGGESATPPSRHDAMLASAVIEDSGSTTSPRGGTPGYAAPEVWRRLDPTPATDQFSYFVMFYEALFGQRPFRGAPGYALSQAPEPALEMPTAPAIPRWLRALITQGLSREPSARHESMARVCAVIRRSRGAPRRRALGLLGGAAALVVLAAPRTSTVVGEAPCHGLVGPDSAWDGPMRARIEEQLASFDARTAGHARDVLEKYAGQLEAARVEACAQPIEVTRERLRCLDDLALAHAASLDFVAQGSAESPATLAKTLDALAAPEDCLPRRDDDDDPTLSASLAEARVLRQAGRAQDGYATAVVACATHTRRDDAPWARCLAEQGLALAVAGREGEAQPLLEEAFALASAVGDEGVAFRLAQMLATQATERRDEPEVLRWIAYLDANARRQDRPKARLVVGIVEGQYLAAFDRFDDAIARLQGLLDDPAAVGYSAQTRVDLETRLGSMRGRIGDVEGAHRHFDRALALLDELSPGDNLVAIVHAMRAQQLGLEGRYDEALSSFRLALAHAEHDLGEASYSAIQARDGIADALMRLDRLDEALALADQNVRMAMSREDINDRVYTLKTRSSIFVALRRLPEARADALQALTIAEGELGICATTRGARLAYATVLVDGGELDRARAVSEQTLAESVLLFGEHHPETMAAVLTLANVEAQLGRHARAIELHERAREGFRATYGDDHPYVALESYNLAESLLALGNVEAARAEAEQALRIWRAALGDDHQDTRDAVELLARTRR